LARASAALAGDERPRHRGGCGKCAGSTPKSRMALSWQAMRLPGFTGRNH